MLCDSTSTHHQNMLQRDTLAGILDQQHVLECHAALGIFALILIITAIKAASLGLTSSFSTMGANSFGIRYKDRNINFGGGGRRSTTKTKAGLKEKKSNNGIPISYDEAREFKWLTEEEAAALPMNRPTIVLLEAVKKRAALR